MKKPAQSSKGRAYGLRPTRAGHPLRLTASPHNGFDGFLPDVVDYRQLLTPVRDQGQEGSCFAHATAALKEFNCSIWGGGTVPLGGWLSVAYLSWRTRLAEGTFPADSGASLADAMAVLNSWGVCPETFLPYNQDPGEAGNSGCDVAALPYRVDLPSTVDIEPHKFRRVLAAKKVIAVGFEVHQSFENTGADGVVPPVPPGEGLMGGHAVLVVGYNEKGFIVRNSWGTEWGDGGHCYWSPDYLAHAFEAWTA